MPNTKYCPHLHDIPICVCDFFFAFVCVVSLLFYGNPLLKYVCVYVCVCVCVYVCVWGGGCVCAV